ncbi:hypothetical protein [Posidoniimonas corsicana]|uniref:hypothetical protein n=1 Tax=Posidoniimonas corsicana TaxID=1938618 RepID=UPI0018D3727D|nr:hypothetical protein [Posidoniimonas corsicana]
MLHSWTAAWRPELLAQTGGLPRVGSAHSPPAPENIPSALAIVPQLSETPELAAWRDALAEASDHGVVLLEGFEHRDQIIAAAVERGLPLTEHGSRWAPEFYALGYAFVQAELLTHSLSYGAIISLDELERRVVEAARAAVEGDDPSVESGLRGAYDLLEQVRDHSFAVQTYLLDLVLLNERTLGGRLERELEEDSPKTFLVSPEVGSALLEQGGPQLSRLREQSVAAACGVESLAGESPEGLRRHVAEAESLARQISPAGHPAIAHTHGGLPPRLASTAAAVDAAGLLVVPLDGLSPPVVDQTRFAWLNPDGDFTETLVCKPRDAGAAAALLGFASQLSDSLYREHLSTEVFAAWAGCRHELFGDLRRVAARSTLLGTMMTVDQYFSETQGVAPNSTIYDDQLAVYTGPGARPEIDANLAAVAGYASALVGGPAASGDSAEDLAALLGRAVVKAKPPAGGSGGRLVFNACSFKRTVLAGGLDETTGRCDLLTAEIVPDVPALGYRVIGDGPPPTQSPTQTADAPARATPAAVQNEHYQVLLDPESGGVRTLRTQSKRRNRLSQRLAVRRGTSRIDLPIRFELDEPRVLACTQDRGAAISAGKIFDLKGGLVARFEQRFYLLARCNRLYIDVLIDAEDATTSLDELRFVSRFALPEADWLINRGVQWSRLPTHRTAFAANEYVHASVGEDSLTLCGTGFGEHLRFGGRMLDSFLPMDADGRCRSRLAVALDEPRPLRVWLDLESQLRPAPIAPCAASAGESGWLVHQDCGNVQISRVRFVDDGPALRLELIETEGRSADVRVQLAKRPSAAYWLGPGGQRRGSLDQLGDSVVLPLNAYESRLIELSW